MERETRFELATSSLARRHSTTELLPHSVHRWILYRSAGRSSIAGPRKRVRTGTARQAFFHVLKNAHHPVGVVGVGSRPLAGDQALEEMLALQVERLDVRVFGILDHHAAFLRLAVQGKLVLDLRVVEDGGFQAAVDRQANQLLRIDPAVANLSGNGAPVDGKSQIEIGDI